MPDGVEALWVRVNPLSHPHNTASIIVSAVYHPPRAAIAQLLTEHLISTAHALRVKYQAAKVVICGNFNRLAISDIQHQLHLTQIVGFPTHDQTTLDLILSNLSQQYQPLQPLPLLRCSNHLTVLWRPKPTTSIPVSAVTRSYRPIPDSALREFGQ